MISAYMAPDDRDSWRPIDPMLRPPFIPSKIPNPIMMTEEQIRAEIARLCAELDNRAAVGIVQDLRVMLFQGGWKLTGPDGTGPFDLDEAIKRYRES